MTEWIGEYPVRFLIMVVLLMYVAIVAWEIWRRRRTRRMVERWAEDNGLILVQCKRRELDWLLFAYALLCPAGFKVIVEDQDGNRRKAVVRCGSFLTGVFSNKVHVKWKT